MDSPTRTLSPICSPYKLGDTTSKFNTENFGSTASYYNSSLKLKSQSIYDLGFKDLDFASVRYHKSKAPLKAVIPSDNQFMVVAKKMNESTTRHLQTLSNNSSSVFKSKFSIDPSTQAMFESKVLMERPRSPVRLNQDGTPVYAQPKKTLIAAKEKKEALAHELELEEKKAKILGSREYEIRDKSGNKMAYDYNGILVMDSDGIKPVKTGKKKELSLKFWH